MFSPIRRLVLTNFSPSRALSVSQSQSQSSQLKYHLSEASSASSSTQQPVILMLGWAGASSKHIDKYVKIYTEAGYNVALCLPQKFNFLVPNSKTGADIDPVFQKYPDNPILIHSFSMNGVRGMISLWKFAGAAKFEQRIHGVLFDSAPCRPYSWQNAFAMALSRAPDGGVGDKKVEAVVKVLNDAYNFLLSPILAAFPSLRSYAFCFYFLTNKIKLPNTPHVLYSTADPIAPAIHVEEFIELQKERGQPVKAINFGDSDHVAHLRAKPVEYKAACMDFVKNYKKKE